MKLTRKSYKRKIVVFGVMMVLAISLISTGFAAWIISQGAEANSEGNVEVGVVTDKAIEITDLTFTADCYYNHATKEAVLVTLEEAKQAKPLAFSFNPVYGDITGRVKFDKKFYDDTYAKADPADPNNGVEALKIKIDGTIVHASMLDKVTVDLEVPTCVKKAVEETYIALPACGFYTGEAKASQQVELGVLDAESDTQTFTYTVAFTWGAKFKQTNPSEFFDNEANEESAYELAEINDILDDLRAKMYDVASDGKTATYGGNRTYDTYDPTTLGKATAPKFKLIITATAK